MGAVLVRIRPRFRSNDRETLEWSMFLCLLMFLSSAPIVYQFVVLIAAAVPTMAVLINRRKWKAALCYLFLYFLACNIRAVHIDSSVVGILAPFLDLTLWCGVALLVFSSFLLYLQKQRLSGCVSIETPLSWRALLSFVSGLWVYKSAWSHCECGRPVGRDYCIPQDVAYLRTSPVSADGRLLYVAMLRDGYRVRDGEIASAMSIRGLILPPIS